MSMVTRPSSRALLLFAAVPLLALGLAHAARAQSWNEAGDAGDQVATAQSTLGAGSLNTILGNLDSPTDVDLYCIHLVAVPPAGLPIVQLQCAVNQGPDVWLFDALGNGVSTNTTCAGGGKTILAPNVSLPAGTYYVAVSFFGNDPQSALGPIWLAGGGAQRTPDGPGAAGALNSWAGSPVVQPLNPYQLNLQFMSYCAGATPALRATWGTLKSVYR